jgi:hypothetical protein
MGSPKSSHRYSPRSARRTRILVAICTVAAGSTSACSYWRERSAGSAPRLSHDTRIELGWQDRIMLPAREIPRYRCPARYLFECDAAGATGTYSCTCVLR